MHDWNPKKKKKIPKCQDFPDHRAKNKNSNLKLLQIILKKY